jgi:hypothetical protein
MSTANQALLATGTFGRTGGAGGSPPPKAGCFGSIAGSGSSIRRAEDDLAMIFQWNNVLLSMQRFNT